MGFHTELMLVYPDQSILGPGKTMWIAQETIRFGYVTRLEKLQRFEREYSGHCRAGICVVSCIMRQLVEKLRVGPFWKDFAPMFLVYYDGAGQHEAYDSARASSGAAYLDCGMCYIDPEPWDTAEKPRYTLRQEHNSALLWTQQQLTCYVETGYNVIMDSLVMWEDCSLIASWLDKVESSNEPEWQELQKHPVALAKGRAWREYLREVGKVGAKALFLFPKY